MSPSGRTHPSSSELIIQKYRGHEPAVVDNQPLENNEEKKTWRAASSGNFRYQLPGSGDQITGTPHHYRNTAPLRTGPRIKELGFPRFWSAWLKRVEVTAKLDRGLSFQDLGFI